MINYLKATPARGSGPGWTAVPAIRYFLDLLAVMKPR